MPITYSTKSPTVPIASAASGYIPRAGAISLTPTQADTLARVRDGLMQNDATFLPGDPMNATIAKILDLIAAA
jgi:hypothetical protein